MTHKLSIRWFHVPSHALHTPQAMEELASPNQDWIGDWCKIEGLHSVQAENWSTQYKNLTGGESKVVSHPSDGKTILFVEYSPRRLARWFDNESSEDVQPFRHWFQQFQSRPKAWELRNGPLRFDLGRPLVMGILNVTPDSFSDGGLFYEVDKAIEHGIQMVEEGAEILDIGGESTRPGSASVSVDDETSRVIPVIQGLAKKVDVPISIDTTKARVAEAALEAGAEIVNDVSNMRFDPQLPAVVAKHKAHVIIMHSRHTPATMQKAPHYDFLWDEIWTELNEGLQRLHEVGVPDSHIGIDPGIGFGKRLEDNYRILRELPALYGQGHPVLVGASRKSFLGAILDLPAPQRVEGSLATAAVSSWLGAHMIRVHDVGETWKMLQVMQAIQTPPQRSW